MATEAPGIVQLSAKGLTEGWTSPINGHMMKALEGYQGPVRVERSAEFGFGWFAFQCGVTWNTMPHPLLQTTSPPFTVVP